MKVSVDHPEYQYIPSRNPYWERLKRRDPTRAMTDQDTEKFQGFWRDQFRSSKPPVKLCVEIGCNGGHWLNSQALRHPDTGYIGIDWKFKQIELAAQKADRASLGNVIYLRAHARRLRYIFAPGEIDRLCIWFPDPWPKRSQQHNRIFQAGFLREASTLIRGHGSIEVKTDNVDYFDFMEQEAAKVSDIWQCENSSRNFLSLPEDTTLFEKIFLKEGLPIHYMKLRQLRPEPAGVVLGRGDGDILG